ncbi:MAG: Hpt domain-containing protein [Acidobacteriota bacterium]|nr:Hpt domain-containing protein [Acidobacteriota bacterium]
MRPAVPEQQLSHFDLAEALSRLGGDSALLAQIASLFVHETRTQLPALRIAIEARDAPSIEHQAHSLKGSVANFGAKDAFGLAQTLERRGRQRDMTGVDEVFIALDRSVGLLIRELESVFQGKHAE